SSEERSYLCRLGCSRICQAMVGTPPAELIFSFSMSCIAFSASKRRISTIFPPLTTVGPSTAKQPVAWKNGTESSVARCGASSGLANTGGCSPRQEAARRREAGRHDVRGHVAMGAERALGPPGGARGVENGGVVFRIELDLR